MKQHKLRKAFTLVELVIVIAVIAVLAVVLVPTFGSVIQRAQDSKAMQEAKNAYTNFVIDSDGETPECMVYQLDGRFVALHNGAPIGVFADKESALGAMMDEYDISKLVSKGNGKLWVYEVGGAGNEENTEPVEVVGDSVSFIPIPEAEEFIKNSTLPEIRIFHGADYYDFQAGKTFQDCLEECLSETYLMYDPDFSPWLAISHVLNIDFRTGETDIGDHWGWINEKMAERACRYAMFTHVLFEATPATAYLVSLEIKEVYCFLSEDSLLRMYIVTNHGEYVYCINRDFNDLGFIKDLKIEHLMPASKFYDLIKASEYWRSYGFDVAQWPEEYLVGEVDLDKMAK